MVAGNIKSGVSIFGITGTYETARRYGYYNHARLQILYYQRVHDSFLDYTNTNNYVRFTSATEVLNWGGVSSNWLTLSESWDLWNSGYRYVCFRVWTNNSVWIDDAWRYLKFWSGWWNLSTSAFIASTSYNVQTISDRITMSGTVSGSHNDLFSTIYIPLMYSTTHLWCTVRAVGSSSGRLVDFAFAGIEMYWTKDKIF